MSDDEQISKRNTDPVVVEVAEVLRTSSRGYKMALVLLVGAIVFGLLIIAGLIFRGPRVPKAIASAPWSVLLHSRSMKTG